MVYENMPLYPCIGAQRDREACVRLPVFGEGRGAPCRSECGLPPNLSGCKRVTIENPCCPGEWAEVLLGLDSCGSLVVCVRRNPPDDCRRPCRPAPPSLCPPPRPLPPPRPRCDGCHGRLYGSWR